MNPAPFTVKAWITWPDEYKEGWCHCLLILENGLVMFDHLCSNPSYALGDLWEHRSDRKHLFESQGLKLEIVAQCKNSEVPPEVLERNKSRTWEVFADKYFADYFKSDDAKPAGATFVFEEDDGTRREVRV
jgi:hypothetical protein